MRTLFRENRIVSSLVGDFDHKSGFELLTDPSIAERLFSPDDRRLFDRHVLWTRVVSDRRTTLPGRAEGELLDYVRRSRELLVLKPNRAYGGEGVAIGAATAQSDWESLLNDAAGKGGDPNASWVVQAATRLPVAEFPVAGADGRIYNEPFYVVMGFAPTDNGIGCLCRVSQKQVVNVAQHGGMAALLVAEQPTDLRIPRRSQVSSESGAKALRREVGEILKLDAVISLLEWDEETYLPGGARGDRGDQVATLETLRHGRLVSDRIGDLIADAELDSESDATLARELHLLKRERHNALALPEDLVRRFAVAKSRALAAWEEARDTNEFAVFREPFSDLLALVRVRARALAGGRALYDTLLNEFEPGMTCARLDPLLKGLRKRLVPLVAAAAVKTARDDTLAGRRFEANAQWLCSGVAGGDGLRLRTRPTRSDDASLHHDGRTARRARDQPRQRGRSVLSASGGDA